MILRAASALAVLLAAGAAQAQAVPTSLGYEGRLLDAQGNPVTGVHSFAFSLFGEASAPADGGAAPPLWTDTLQVAVVDGLYSVRLGADANHPPIDAALLAGAAGQLYLEIAVDGETLSPRQAVSSVPYALQASSVAGGSVDATSLSINGQPIVDSSGTWVGAAPYMRNDGNTSTVGAVTAAGFVSRGAGLGPIAGNSTVQVDGKDVDGNAKIELKGGTPYIDFSANGSADNQGRVRLIAANQLGVENADFWVGSPTTATLTSAGALAVQAATVANDAQVGGSLSVGLAPAVVLGNSGLAAPQNFTVASQQGLNLNSVSNTAITADSAVSISAVTGLTLSSQTDATLATNGNVHITAPLQVSLGPSGNPVRVDPASNLIVPGYISAAQIGSGERLRMLRGTVQGPTTHGSGFTLNQPSPGTYTVTFNNAFSDVPACIVLPASGFSAGLSSVSTTACTFSFAVGSVAAPPPVFSFEVIGPE